MSIDKVKSNKMKKAVYNKDLKERLDRLTHEIVQLKSSLIYQAKPDKSKSSKAWVDLMKASEDVSSRWSGYSALEEIQAQRGR